MTKLTKSQRAAVVRLFLSGTTTKQLAEAYGVDVLKIEQIIRQAMTTSHISTERTDHAEVREG